MPRIHARLDEFENTYVKVLEYVGHLGGYHYYNVKCKACESEWQVRASHIKVRRSCGCRRSSEERIKVLARNLMTTRWA